MSQKQQALMKLLNHNVRQYFVFDKEEEDSEKPRQKIRLRNELHCVEDPVSKEAKEQQLLQRIYDNKIGLLTPEYQAFDPVSGWPVLRLEELVLNTLQKHLDPKIWQVIKSYFQKNVVKRMTERKDHDAAIKDLSVVFKYPTAGFSRIKAHLTETEARMHSVKAGFDYQKHLIKTIEYRNRRTSIKDEGVHKFSADPDVVVAKERVRKDMISFLKALIDLLEKMLLLKERHLKSTIPINLHILGTDKDRDRERHTGRVLQYPGGPPVVFSFKDQIISEAPPCWPLMSKYAPARKRPYPVAAKLSQTSQSSAFLPNSEERRQRKSLVTPVVTRQSSSCGTPVAVIDTGLQDPDMRDHFRKLWPPVWMSLAALEQGCNIVDPDSPTREFRQTLHASTRQRKSMTSVLATRDSWMEIRQAMDKSVEETLWREDKERLDFFRVEFASLAHLHLAKPYPTHQRNMYRQLAQTRCQRQQETIFDCELSLWYKYLVNKVEEQVGKTDEEVNHLLEKVKVHFKMSATFPRFAKAKLALIAMSMPATVVTHIHVQRAIRFMLCNVLQAPESMLIGWLATRDLPFVLLSSHVI